MYALRVLRAHGLKGDSLWDVSRATLVAKLTYASPAWWGLYASETQKRRLHRLLIKLQRCGFLPAQFDSMADLCSAAYDALFRSILSNENHVLHIHCSHLSRAQVIMTSAHAHTAELSQELTLECEEISFSGCCITVFFSYYVSK